MEKLLVRDAISGEFFIGMLSDVYPPF